MLAVFAFVAISVLPKHAEAFATYDLRVGWSNGQYVTYLVPINESEGSVVNNTYSYTPNTSSNATPTVINNYPYSLNPSNPAPVIYSVNPNSINAGTGDTTIKIIGADFVRIRLGGGRDGAHVENRFDGFAIGFEEIEQLLGVDDVGQLALGDILPLAVVAQAVTNHQTPGAALFQSGQDIGPDEPGSACDNVHRNSPSLLNSPLL